MTLTVTLLTLRAQPCPDRGLRAGISLFLALDLLRRAEKPHHLRHHPVLERCVRAQRRPRLLVQHVSLDSRRLSPLFF